MEHGVSVMRRLVLTFFALSIGLAIEQVRAEDSVVLVTSADSSIRDVSSIEVRKLFLGFTVNTGNGKPIHAVTNLSDERLWQVFLQGVMGMSERSYDRRLLTLTLQSGRPRPAVVQDVDAALLAIITDGNAITFAWSYDVDDRDDIRVLRVLWQD